MTTVMIEDNSPEGKWLLNLIKNHKSVTVVKDDSQKKNFQEAVIECNGHPASEFFEDMRRQAKERFKNA